MVRAGRLQLRQQQQQQHEQRRPSAGDADVARPRTLRELFERVEFVRAAHLSNPMTLGKMKQYEVVNPQMRQQPGNAPAANGNAAARGDASDVAAAPAASAAPTPVPADASVAPDADCPLLQGPAPVHVAMKWPAIVPVGLGLVNVGNVRATRGVVAQFGWRFVVRRRSERKLTNARSSSAVSHLRVCVRV